MHGLDGTNAVVVEEPLLDYLIGTQRYPMVPSMFVGGATVTDLDADVLAAYDAPYPDAASLAGVRQMPMLVPLTRTDPGASINRRTTEFLRGWIGPCSPLSATAIRPPAVGSRSSAISCRVRRVSRT